MAPAPLRYDPSKQKQETASPTVQAAEQWSLPLRLFAPQYKEPDACNGVGQERTDHNGQFDQRVLVERPDGLLVGVKCLDTQGGEGNVTQVQQYKY